MADALSLDPRRTALVLIDLQAGILGMPVGPHSAGDVLDRGVKLAAHFRDKGVVVVLVRVSFSASGADRPAQPTDFETPAKRPDGWDVLSPALGSHVGDIRITKRQWGAFYGTELDLQLRRRGIDTIVIGGISTNFGVESTARDAFERSYSVIFVEDAMSSANAEMHAFAVTRIFPRLGRIRSTDQVMQAF